MSALMFSPLPLWGEYQLAQPLWLAALLLLPLIGLLRRRRSFFA